MTANDHDDDHRKATALGLGQDGARILAQGTGAMAQRIEQLAREHDIHVLQDFALSANLSQLAVGDTIPDPVFKALGVVLDLLFSAEEEAGNA